MRNFLFNNICKISAILSGLKWLSNKVDLYMQYFAIQSRTETVSGALQRWYGDTT